MEHSNDSLVRALLQNAAAKDPAEMAEDMATIHNKIAGDEDRIKDPYKEILSQLG